MFHWKKIIFDILLLWDIRDESTIMFYLFEAVTELCSFNISDLFVALFFNHFYHILSTQNQQLIFVGDIKLRDWENFLTWYLMNLFFLMMREAFLKMSFFWKIIHDMMHLLQYLTIYKMWSSQKRDTIIPWWWY